MTARTCAPALGVAVLLLLPAGRAGAATYTVNSTADLISPQLMANCASGSGPCTLRAAIAQANVTVNPVDQAESIELPAGTYALSVAGRDEDLGWTGDLDITDDVVIFGGGYGVTTIDGAGLDRVLDIRKPPTRQLNVQLQNVTITGGLAIDSGLYGSDNGGGIRSDTGLMLDAVVIDGNEAESGGGLYVGVQGAASAVLSRTWITNNTTTSTGAALWTTGSGSVLLYGCTIAGNTGLNIVATHGALTRLDDCSVRDNINLSSAAIATNNTVVLRRTSVTGNALGGLQVITQANLGRLELESSTVSGNGTWGVTVESGGELVVTGSTIGPHPSGCVNNFAGSVRLLGSIVHCPGSSQPACSGAGGPPVSLGYNIDNDGSCGLGATGDLPSTDALLQALTDGFRPVHPIPPDSPAVDAWSEGPWPAQDGRGTARPLDGDGDGLPLGDIGAYEYDARLFWDDFELGGCYRWSDAVGETSIP